MFFSLSFNESYAGFYVGVESGPVYGNFNYHVNSLIDQTGGLINPNIFNMVNIADLDNTVIGIPHLYKLLGIRYCYRLLLVLVVVG